MIKKRKTNKGKREMKQARTIILNINESYGISDVVIKVKTKGYIGGIKL